MPRSEQPQKSPGLADTSNFATEPAPIAATFAEKLGFQSDAFLMAVAIGAGCDFLTPIGHQCNTLVMAPGGYRFGDYSRLGLPLSIVVLIVSVPMLLLAWPI